MDKNWDFETCNGVDISTAMILATGLVAKSEREWIPSTIYWNSHLYDRFGFAISKAFVSCYLRQDWPSGINR
jgi:hypothetical protein